jgi:hypothetical protein
VGQTPKNSFQGLRTALSAFLGHQKGAVPTESAVKVPVRAEMSLAVRRFQGKYECGCEADPLEGPEFCEIHEKSRLYVVEFIESHQTTVETKEE